MIKKSGSRKRISTRSATCKFPFEMKDHVTDLKRMLKMKGMEHFLGFISTTPFINLARSSPVWLRRRMELMFYNHRGDSGLSMSVTTVDAFAKYGVVY